jgi:hypothetical protein
MEALRETIVLQSLLTRAKFKLADKHTVNIHDHCERLENDFFNPNMSDGDKIRIFQKSMDQDALDLIERGEEQYAIQWARSHPPNPPGMQAADAEPVRNLQKEFRTPQKKTIMVAAEAIYVLPYVMYKTIAIRAILGEDAKSDAFQQMEKIIQGRNDLRVHIVHFSRAMKRYLGNDKPSEALEHLVTKTFYRSLNKNVLERMTSFPSEMEAAIASAERAGKVVAALNSSAKGRGADEETAQYAATLTVWDRCLNPHAEPSLKGLVGALNAAKDSRATLQCLASFCAVDLREGHVPHGQLAPLRAGVQAALKECLSTEQAVNAITHLLPNKYTRKVTHSSETTQEFDLEGKSKQQLRDQHKHLRFVNGLKPKRDRESDSDTDGSGDEEEEPGSKETDKRRSKRAKVGKNKDIAALTETVAALKQTIERAEYRNHTSRLDQQRHERSAGQAGARPTGRPGPQERPQQGNRTYNDIPFAERPCRVCKGRHECSPSQWRLCPDLFKNGEKLAFCVVCNKTGHESTACPQLRDVVCRECNKKGHRASHCPKAQCRQCLQYGHVDRYCPNRKGGRGH